MPVILTSKGGIHILFSGFSGRQTAKRELS